MNNKTHTNSRRKPDWLKIKVPIGKSYVGVKEIVKKNKLYTICTSGNCPNMEQCWSRGTATLMILGNICTRACKFCNVLTGKPLPADLDEPRRVAESVQKLNLRHVVLTSVDRDDLPDGGAAIWADVINTIKATSPQVTIEALIPDFQGKKGALETVIASRPQVLSHNMETVRRLTPQLRSKAKYDSSLEVIRQIGEAGIISKSGIMVGIGETHDEVFEVMDDLRSVNCQVMTIGQYLQPTPQHYEVKEYVHPDIFAMYKMRGKQKGFRHVESSPLVRSSYQAEKHIR